MAYYYQKTKQNFTTAARVGKKQKKQNTKNAKKNLAKIKKTEYTILE